MKKSRDNYTFLTHAPVHRVIFTMAIPTIISMLSTSMYNLADTYFVGSINTQSVAAVGVSFAMMSVIQAVGFLYGHGSGNYISRMLGAKEVEKAKKMASTGFVLSFLTGLLIAILGQLFLTPLCILLGSTPTIQPYAERYLGIILLGAPFMTTSLTLNNQQALQQLGLPSGGAALGCAVTYPLGVVGVILAMMFLRKLFVKPEDLEIRRADEDDSIAASRVLFKESSSCSTSCLSCSIC